MADKYIEAGGRRYRLKYTVNAMCAVEERSGGALDQLMDRQFSACRLLLWGALIAHQPETTLDQAGEIIGSCLMEGGTLEDIVNISARLIANKASYKFGYAEIEALRERISAIVKERRK